MQRKPTPEEFEITDTGIEHMPTGASFVPFPGKPTQGTWHAGSPQAANGDEYDMDDVKEMMRRVLANELIK
jgi:hypothetical protein